MNLQQAMHEKGYAFRQHLQEAGWGERKLTVVDLSPDQSHALEQGGLDALAAKLDAQQSWAFPALDIRELPPASGELCLVDDGIAKACIVAPDDQAHHHLWQLAQRLQREIKARHGVTLPLLGANQAGLDLLAQQHVIVVGGAHENPWAMAMALRFQTMYIDATVPGPDGWCVTTHAGLTRHRHNVLQITGSEAHHDAILACIHQATIIDKDGASIAATHVIHQGSLMRQHFPKWEVFTSKLTTGMPQFENHPRPRTTEPVALASALALGLDSGGLEKSLYNSAPIDVAIMAACYYQQSADPRGLALFKALLFELADYYLKTPQGASYPADIDFRIGLALLYYARLEHDPIFTQADRLILTNLFLSCTRAVHQYASIMWPMDPKLGRAHADTRHNHQTFKARTLLYAADYFDRYHIQGTSQWLEYTHDVFKPDTKYWRRSKQAENANGYEEFVFEHGCNFSTFLGRGLEAFDSDCLKQLVKRMIITTDNFMRGVDYGDAHVSMACTSSVIARLLAFDHDDPGIHWFAHERFAREHPFVMLHLRNFPGIAQSYDGPAPAGGQWELAPMDRVFFDEQCANQKVDPSSIDFDATFDKLAFRTGWGDDDHYLLYEGLGNLPVSHSHVEINGIVRLNHLGRHWLVSNGYGRRRGVTNVSKSFASRVRGPFDHNMLVFYKDDGVVDKLPFCSQMVQRGGHGPLHHVTTVLKGYAGVDWYRTLVVLAGHHLLVLDRIKVHQPTFDRGHIEWNMLGQVEPLPGQADSDATVHGRRLSQQGVYMDVQSTASWSLRQEVSDLSANWEQVLTSGQYPYAQFPLAKLVHAMPDASPGSVHQLATLFAATTQNVPACSLLTTGENQLDVTGPSLPLLTKGVDDHDLHIKPIQGGYRMQFASLPQVS